MSRLSPTSTYSSCCRRANTRFGLEDPERSRSCSAPRPGGAPARARRCRRKQTWSRALGPRAFECSERRDEPLHPDLEAGAEAQARRGRVRSPRTRGSSARPRRGSAGLWAGAALPRGSGRRGASNARTGRVPSWSSSRRMRAPNAAGESATSRDAVRKLANVTAWTKQRSDSRSGSSDT